MTGMKRARSVKFEGIGGTMNQPTDINTIPFSEMTQEQREAANREHRYRLARDRAVRMLGYHLLLASGRYPSGMPRRFNVLEDAEKSEVEAIVDSIIEAARNSS